MTAAHKTQNVHVYHFALMNPLPNIEFHNTTPEVFLNTGGWNLPRYPADVRKALSKQGQRNSLFSAGCEIRFVTDAPAVRLFLAGVEDAVNVCVYRGSHFFGHFDVPASIPSGQITCLRHAAPERFPLVAPELLRGGPFSPDVWRFVIGRTEAVFHGLDAYGYEVRPPAPSEKPRLRWLAYGSSITESSWRGYPHQAAWRLGVDVLNKGLGDSCHIEPEVVDYLADTLHWDFATCELGINMRGVFTTEEFARRARYLVRRFLEAKPGKPLVFITTTPNYALYLADDLQGKRNHAFNAILRDLASEYAPQGVCLIEGADLLTDFCQLTADLVHPTELGHVQMGENLARLLSERLPGFFKK